MSSFSSSKLTSLVNVSVVGLFEICLWFLTDFQTMAEFFCFCGQWSSKESFQCEFNVNKNRNASFIYKKNTFIDTFWLSNIIQRHIPLATQFWVAHCPICPWNTTLSSLVFLCCYTLSSLLSPLSLLSFLSKSLITSYSN